MSLVKLAIEEIKLQSHQKSAIKKLDKSKSLITYHGLGSGKTLTAIKSGEETEGIKLVLTPASLAHNFRKELHKFNIPDTNYKLVSYEKFRRNPQLIMDKYKPSMIIADEFHRSQNSDNLLGEALRNSRPKVKSFLGLTGSVIQNHPSEIASLLHTATGKPILGSEKQFRQHFINERKVKPGILGRLTGKTPGVVEEAKNLKDFKKYTEPFIDTFSGDEEYQKHMPQVERETIRIPMSDEQAKIYDYTFGKAPRWVKFKIRNNLPPSKKESLSLNSFLIGSRQASTSLEPFGSHSSTPKIDAVINDIQSGIKKDKNFKGVVYSSFLQGGLNSVGSRLKKLNIPYGSFTGQQTHTERNLMVHDYNNGKLKALLISPAGGEGLDLKGTKYVGLMNSEWNPQRLEQVVGRAARYKSHEKLPENERKVLVKQYLSEPKLGLIGKIKKIFNPQTHAIGSDEYINNISKRKQELNDQFTNILKGMQ